MENGELEQAPNVDPVVSGGKRRPPTTGAGCPEGPLDPRDRGNAGLRTPYSTSVTTPMATMVFWSRREKRPRGGYSQIGSTHILPSGRILTEAVSPTCNSAGRSSRASPVRLSMRESNSSKTQGTCDVWQEIVSGHPSRITPGRGRLSTMTCATNDEHSRAAQLISEPTMPRRKSFMATSTRKLTVSPLAASKIVSWCISSERTCAVTFPGTKRSFMPGRRKPVSTRPTEITPLPPTCRTSDSGMRRGRSGMRVHTT
mmetsp:Transcript_52597/g.140163  ORF Transcript_52597/g.140163 Transcript_52597/m.140163 type:complete len:257 (+) Transcript_52597:230-1000(+)